MSKDSRRGQSLIELVVGITIGVLFITAALGLISVSLRIDFQNKFSQTAGELSQELIEQVSAYANANWHGIYDLTRNTAYTLSPDGVGWFDAPTLTPSLITISDTDYTPSFTVSDVYRNALSGDIDEFSSILDPSTLKITATTAWTQAGSPGNVSMSKYVTRIRNRVWNQTDWSGTPDATSVFDSADYPSGADSSHFASLSGIWRGDTNPSPPPATLGQPGQLEIDLATAGNRIDPGGFSIDPTTPNHYAWNDVMGWLDFAYTSTYPVTIDSTISGIVGSNVGPVSLDCARSPNGNACGISYSVTKSTNSNNDGVLSGYAWNDMIGWISFNCTNDHDPITAGVQSLCGTVPYGVTLTSNIFSGWAWNDIAGWISFNCTNDHDPITAGVQSLCGTTPYLVRVVSGIPGVKEGKLESATFDFGLNNKAAVNTITWIGTPNGGTVQFKVASSDCPNGATNAPTCDTGTWAYYGPDAGDNNQYYSAASGVQIPLTRINHDNKRYMRYYIYLLANSDNSQSPVVDDVIVNWSL